MLYRFSNGSVINISDISLIEKSQFRSGEQTIWNIYCGEKLYLSIGEKQYIALCNFIKSMNMLDGYTEDLNKQ